MGLQRFPISGFSEGLNIVDDPYELRMGAASEAWDFVLLKDGEIRVPNNFKLFTASGMPGSADSIQRLGFWSAGPAGGGVMLASISGDIYSITQAGAATQRFNSASATAWTWEIAPDAAGTVMAWFSCQDASVVPQKWDGAAATTSAWAGAPPRGLVSRLWKNRMVIGGVAAFPDRLYFSDIGNPEAGYTDTVDIRTRAGDRVRDLLVLGDYLVVLKDKTTWLVYDPGTLENRKILDLGVHFPGQAVVINKKLYLGNESGVWSVDSLGNNKLESRALNPLFKTLSFASHQRVQMHRIEGRIERDPSGTNLHGERLLITGIITGFTLGPVLECCLDLETNKGEHPWLTHITPGTIGGSCYGTFDSSEATGYNFYVGHSVSGQVYNMWDPTSTGARLARWRTNLIKVISDEPYERWRRLNAIYQGTTSTRRVTITTDEGLVYGPLNYPSRASVGLDTVRPESRGRAQSILFELTGGVGAPGKLVSAEIALRGGKEH